MIFGVDRDLRLTRRDVRVAAALDLAAQRTLGATATQIAAQGVRPDNVLQWLREVFVERLRAAVAGHPIHVTSWCRSRADNERVGGAALSQHLVCLAADLIPLSDPNALVLSLRRQRLSVIIEPDHIHVQLIPGRTWRDLVDPALQI